jgi:hypothetical protein
MSYQFTSEPKEGFVHVRVSGENTPDNVRSYLREVYELCARTGASSVLIEEDLRGSRLDPVEVYRIIMSASADTLPVILRIAYVDLQAQDDHSNVDLSVEIARDRGVNVAAFRTVADAEAWLSL